jgi:hypothetical protein
MKKLIGICFLCLISFTAGRYSIVVKPISESLTTATKQLEQAREEAQGKPITDAQYQQIKEGMTVAQVEAILGKGKSGGETQAMGKTFTSYSWSWRENGKYRYVSVGLKMGLLPELNQDIN